MLYYDAVSSLFQTKGPGPGGEPNLEGLASNLGESNQPLVGPPVRAISDFSVYINLRHSLVTKFRLFLDMSGNS